LFDGFEWWLIECNPRRREHLQKVLAQFGASTSVQFLPMAAWTENTTLSFHIDDDVAESDHGSSLFADHAMVHADGMKTEVNALDFPKFLESHFQQDDFLLCRMDIEGAE
jgi:FkbM family methyltransferase